MGIAKKTAGRLAPKATRLAPQLTSTFVHQALDRAIKGVSKLPGAAPAADKALRANDGDLEKATRDIIEAHVRYAGAEGFLTNLGGLTTLPVTVPANIAGLALIECRLVAAIVHLRGFDLDDTRTRTAILATVLGEERVLGMVKTRALPGPPMAIATAPVADPHLAQVIANEVAAELITRVAGKRLAISAGRRVPVVGGAFGAAADAYATWKIGRYAGREFLPRRRR